MKAWEALKALVEGLTVMPVGTHYTYKLKDGALKQWIKAHGVWRDSYLTLSHFAEQQEWEVVNDPSRLSPADVVKLLEEGVRLKQTYKSGAFNLWRKEDGIIQRWRCKTWIGGYDPDYVSNSPCPWEGEWSVDDEE